MFGKSDEEERLGSMVGFVSTANVSGGGRKLIKGEVRDGCSAMDSAALLGRARQADGGSPGSHFGFLPFLIYLATKFGWAPSPIATVTWCTQEEKKVCPNIGTTIKWFGANVFRSFDEKPQKVFKIAFRKSTNRNKSFLFFSGSGLMKKRKEKG